MKNDLTGLVERASDWLTMHAPQPDPVIQEAVDLLLFFVAAAILEKDEENQKALTERA